MSKADNTQIEILSYMYSIAPEKLYTFGEKSNTHDLDKILDIDSTEELERHLAYLRDCYSFIKSEAGQKQRSHTLTAEGFKFIDSKIRHKESLSVNKFVGMAAGLAALTGVIAFFIDFVQKDSLSNILTLNITAVLAILMLVAFWIWVLQKFLTELRAITKN